MHKHINSKSAHCGEHYIRRSPECEFCSELINAPGHRFGNLYGPSISRAVLQHNGFVAIPTIGQLFEASMLVLPDEHIERMADLDEDQIRECLTFVEGVVERVSSYGSPIVCEHGARAATGGGCGIFHAHFHVIPTPSKEPSLRIEHLMPMGADPVRASSIGDALDRLKETDEYLLVRDADYRIAFIEVTPEIKPSVPSQFFRQSLVARYGLANPWDWREYGFEERMVSTIDYFRSSVT